MKIRSVLGVVEAMQALEGAGFLVHRPFPTPQLSVVDPFLLLDEMGPIDMSPGEAKGAPDHPHRGFETVTYVLDGKFEHRDSHGHSGSLESGDVQWMTAGAGVIHSEMPAREMSERGGRMHGFQLWVNLPKRDKMMNPRYQEMKAADIPHASADGVSVKVIAGQSMGKSAVIDTRTPILYLHFHLDAGATFTQPVPASFNVFAYLIGTHECVVYERDGEAVELVAPDDAPLDLLLIGGEPLGEPVARYGPFVMNTPEEIMQAIEDFQSGKMGEIPPDVPRV